jgi:hypothetical protein
MSTNDKHTARYTASEIRKYLAGELTARQMHDLEQAALEDPFLADAIEGMTAYPVSPEDLNDLRERLNRKVAADNRRGAIIRIRRLISIAAALILLLGIGYTFVYHRNASEKASQQVVSHLVAPAPARDATSPATDTIAKPGDVAAGITSQPDYEAMRTPKGKAVRAKAAAERYLSNVAQTPGDSAQYAFTQTRAGKRLRANFPKYPPLSTANALTVAKAPLPSFSKFDSDSVTYLASDSIVALAEDKARALYSATIPLTDSLKIIGNKSLGGKLYKSDSLGLFKTYTYQQRAATDGYFYRATPTGGAAPTSAGYLVFTGKVLDQQDHPIAGAFLALRGNYGYGTTTDDQGRFRLSLHPRDSTQQLTVSMIGYDHTSLAVNALSTLDRLGNIIRLRPSTTNLDEVVVVGYGMHRKEARLAAPSDSDEKLDSTWSSAAPVIGRLAYLQYLSIAKNKLGLDSTITGTETISFLVSRNEPLSAFKIERSLSPAHDAGILRLITDGPAWRLFRGRKTRVSVTVNF